MGQAFLLSQSVPTLEKKAQRGVIMCSMAGGVECFTNQHSTVVGSVALAITGRNSKYPETEQWTDQGNLHIPVALRFLVNFAGI